MIERAVVSIVRLVVAAIGLTVLFCGIGRELPEYVAIGVLILILACLVGIGSKSG